MQSAYYLKNFLGSFIGLTVVTGIALTILEYTPEPYTYIGIIFGLSIVFLGLTLIGYTNAATLLNNKMKHTLYLHSILVILLFTTDLIFGNKDLLFTILRNVGFFVVLQFGVYLYVKKQPMSFKEFLKLT